jgi:peptide/nickel transport system permease protein
MKRAWWIGAVALALLVVTLLLFGQGDPNAQPDGLVLRNLPPFARVDTFRLLDGSTLYVEEWERNSDNSIRYRRGVTWTTMEAAIGPTSSFYLFGTDTLGRDLTARILSGGKISLLVGLLAAGMAVLTGSIVGLAAGFSRGWIDGALMRGTDLALMIPRLYLALLLVMLFGPSLLHTVLILGGTSWMATARLVRGQVLALRQSDQVASARAAGATPLRQALLHVFPAATGPVLVEAALRTGDSILLETSLSFLGLGVQPPTASWGSLIADGKNQMFDAWWIAALPGIAVALTVLLVTLGSRWRRSPAGS